MPLHDIKPRFDYLFYDTRWGAKYNLSRPRSRVWTICNPEPNVEVLGNSNGIDQIRDQYRINHYAKNSVCVCMCVCVSVFVFVYVCLSASVCVQIRKL